MGEGRRERNNVGDGLGRNKKEDFLNATRDGKKKSYLYPSGEYLEGVSGSLEN